MLVEAAAGLMSTGAVSCNAPVEVLAEVAVSWLGAVTCRLLALVDAEAASAVTAVAVRVRLVLELPAAIARATRAGALRLRLEAEVPVAP